MFYFRFLGLFGGLLGGISGRCVFPLSWVYDVYDMEIPTAFLVFPHLEDVMLWRWKGVGV